MFLQWLSLSLFNFDSVYIPIFCPQSFCKVIFIVIKPSSFQYFFFFWFYWVDFEVKGYHCVITVCIVSLCDVANSCTFCCIDVVQSWACGCVIDNPCPGVELHYLFQIVVSQNILHVLNKAFLWVSFWANFVKVYVEIAKYCFPQCLKEK